MNESNSCTVRETRISMYHIVKPEDCSRGILRAGPLLKWMDICACLSAERLSRSPSVTLSMDNLTFQSESHEGDAVSVMAQSTRAFNSSVEILVVVTSEETGSVICSAFFVFVSFRDGKKVALPTTIPETELEQLNYLSAGDRRSARMNAKELLKEAQESVQDDEEDPLAGDSSFTVRATVSTIAMTHVVMPSDANHMGNTFGGQLMEWAEEYALLAARRHVRASISLAAKMGSDKGKAEGTKETEQSPSGLSETTTVQSLGCGLHQLNIPSSDDAEQREISAEVDIGIDNDIDNDIDIETVDSHTACGGESTPLEEKKLQHLQEDQHRLGKRQLPVHGFLPSSDSRPADPNQREERHPDKRPGDSIRKKTAMTNNSNDFTVRVVGVDSMSFVHPSTVGDRITLRGHVYRTYGAWMEVGIVITAVDVSGQRPRHINTGYFTVVALSENKDSAHASSRDCSGSQQLGLSHDSASSSSLRRPVNNHDNNDDGHDGSVLVPLQHVAQVLPVTKEQQKSYSESLGRFLLRASGGGYLGAGGQGNNNSSSSSSNKTTASTTAAAAWFDSESGKSTTSDTKVPRSKPSSADLAAAAGAIYNGGAGGSGSSSSGGTGTAGTGSSSAAAAAAAVSSGSRSPAGDRAGDISEGLHYCIDEQSAADLCAKNIWGLLRAGQNYFEENIWESVVVTAPRVRRRSYGDVDEISDERGGLKVLYSTDGSGITTVKMTAILRADMETAFNSIMNIDKRNQWDPYRKQELRRVIDRQNDIIWMTMRPVDGRTKGGADFSLLRSWTRSENQVIIAVRSIDSDDVPATGDYDRQYVFPSGYIISKEYTNTNASTATSTTTTTTTSAPTTTSAATATTSTSSTNEVASAAVAAAAEAAPAVAGTQTKVTYILQIGESLSSMYQGEIEGRAAIVQNSFYQLCNYIESM